MKTEEQRIRYNAYMREYNLKRYYRLRGEALSHLGGKCVKCESTDRLELDHINRFDKEVEISRMLNSTIKKFWNEVKKCQLLCRPCHTKKSILERGNKVAKGKHGTISTYRYCKCEECRNAKNIYYQRYKSRRKSRIKTPS